jgi:hypothetical protein
MKIVILVFSLLLVFVLFTCKSSETLNASVNVAETNSVNASEKPPNISKREQTLLEAKKAFSASSTEMNKLVGYLQAKPSATFDSFTNCYGEPKCDEALDLTSADRSSMMGGILAETSKGGTTYHMNLISSANTHVLIITVSNQNRNPQTLDYQLLDCGTNGSVEEKRIVNLKGVTNLRSYQIRENSKLIKLCAKQSNATLEDRLLWQVNYSSIVSQILDILD